MSWGVVYYRTSGGPVPADAFLDACPAKVEATILAVLEAVRAAPPPAFSGGGKWEAMHGSMAGYYEIRVTGPGRRHYRLFCLLDNGSDEELAQRGFEVPQIVVINGMVKQHMTEFSDAEYRRNVRDLGDDYLGTLPRPLATSNSDD
jgi:Txe/YoeB family toxin of Txe-Axe toxin-antitoxin module